MESEIRMIRKRFKCSNCQAKLSKLVGASDTFSKCETCNGLMREVSEEEYLQKSRDQINQNYRIVFDKNNGSGYHNRFDSKDTRKFNTHGDTDKKFTREEQSNRNERTNRQSNNLGRNQNYSGNLQTDRNERNFSNNHRQFNNNSTRNQAYNENGTHRANNHFRNYNIYPSNGENGFNNSTFHQRTSSPQNNNSYNFFQNHSSRTQENRREQSTNNMSAGIGNIFSNFFGLGGNSNTNSNLNSDYNRNSNYSNNFYSNLNSNTRRYNTQSNPNNFFSDFFSGFNVDFSLSNPFGESPFMGRINRHHFDNDIFDPGFQTFGTTFNNFFQDNFSSNFRSNFRSQDNFYDIYNLIRNRNENQSAHPATSKEALKNLKKFKMNDKYCKKNEKGELETPNCSVCISDISKGEETLLLPCGHMYHSGCVEPWLKKNNTCPVCRFELPPEK